MLLPVCFCLYFWLYVFACLFLPVFLVVCFCLSVLTVFACLFLPVFLPVCFRLSVFAWLQSVIPGTIPGVMPGAIQEHPTGHFSKSASNDSKHLQMYKKNMIWKQALESFIKLNSCSFSPNQPAPRRFPSK